MTSRRRDQTGHDSDQIIVHVPGISQRRRRGGHHRSDELIGLLEGGLLDVKCVGCDSGEGAVVEDYHCVGVLCQASEGEEGVVGLYYDVAGALTLGVWEDGVGLDDLFWEAVV